MKVQIEDTSLVITGIVYRKTQLGLRRQEAGESIIVMAVEDTKTGETGLVSRYQAFDKRDTDEEEFTTNNAKLFTANHPDPCFVDECCWETDDDIGDEKIWRFDVKLETYDCITGYGLYVVSPDSNRVRWDGSIE